MNRTLKFLSSYISMCLLIGFVTLPIVSAAPDPLEIEKNKVEAPFHIIGTVLKDEIHDDLSEEKGHYYQIRKMTVKVNQRIKSPDITENNSLVEVYYVYIPTWQDIKYTGYHPTNIMVNDEIEVWLERSELGWEPALGMYTVEHLNFAHHRIEPIPEPGWHIVKRKVFTAMFDYTPFFVLGCVLIFVMIVILTTVNNMKLKGN
ncbi:hypothetical protein ACFSCX_19680 [Bacillus salitolerans]|uniref:Uncharacterized protein n=1 Tax=Bacillus salitolerans TaxID=1437434 RepID=A0ABW4LV24_9BACI